MQFNWRIYEEILIIDILLKREYIRFLLTIPKMFNPESSLSDDPELSDMLLKVEDMMPKLKEVLNASLGNSIEKARSLLKIVIDLDSVINGETNIQNLPIILQLLPEVLDEVKELFSGHETAFSALCNELTAEFKMLS